MILNHIFITWESIWLNRGKSSWAKRSPYGCQRQKYFMNCGPVMSAMISSKLKFIFTLTEWSRKSLSMEIFRVNLWLKIGILSKLFKDQSWMNKLTNSTSCSEIRSRTCQDPCKLCITSLFKVTFSIFTWLLSRICSTLGLLTSMKTHWKVQLLIKMEKWRRQLLVLKLLIFPPLFKIVMTTWSGVRWFLRILAVTYSLTQTLTFCHFGGPMDISFWVSDKKRTIYLCIPNWN